MSTPYEMGANALKVVNRGLYSGVSNFEISSEEINQLYSAGKLTIPEDWGKLYPNHFLILKSGSQSAMGRVSADRKTVRIIKTRKEDIWSIFPRNKEQLFAMDLLLDDSVQLVTLSGTAGTGKTLLSLACALKRTADLEKYRKILVGRPVIPMGRDLGYLPGDLNEKMAPWIQPIYDNLEFLFDSSGKSKKNHEYQYLLDSGLIKVEALTYIRGRSIPKQFIIIDEAQNLSPHEVKTILTRAGDGTKVVLTGDPFQIDKHNLTAESNGLTYVAKRFKDERIAGHVTLLKCERSELAEIAARLL